MGETTKISWAEATWNPVWGCTPVSEGCDNCYAAAFSKRIGRDFSPRPVKGAANLQPEHWKEPKIIFVPSMGDLFHPAITNEWRDEIFARMENLPHHRFMVLTKRAKEMEEYLRRGKAKVVEHIWLGVTVENQRRYIERVGKLPLSFLSVEPMLGPIQLIWGLNEGLKMVICGGENHAGARPMKKEWKESLEGQCRGYGIDFHFKGWGTAATPHGKGGIG